VLGELGKRQLVAPDRRGAKVTAVEEGVDRLFQDRPVRVALVAGMVGELTESPFLDLEPVPAGVAQSDKVGDQIRQRRLRHCAHHLWRPQ
jgi:hypothetical protein